MTDEIEYTYKIGKGWVAGYKHINDMLEELDKDMTRAVLEWLRGRPEARAPRR